MPNITAADWLVRPDIGRQTRRLTPAKRKRPKIHPPQVYRRLTTWGAFEQAQIFKGDFPDWLTDKAETFWYLPEFRELNKKAQKYLLYDRDFDGDGVGWEPKDFIFAESPSSIQNVNAAGELVKIMRW